MPLYICILISRNWQNWKVSSTIPRKLSSTSCIIHHMYTWWWTFVSWSGYNQSYICVKTAWWGDTVTILWLNNFAFFMVKVGKKLNVGCATNMALHFKFLHSFECVEDLEKILPHEVVINWLVISNGKDLLYPAKLTVFDDTQQNSYSNSHLYCTVTLYTHSDWTTMVPSFKLSFSLSYKMSCHVILVCLWFRQWRYSWLHDKMYQNREKRWFETH